MKKNLLTVILAISTIASLVQTTTGTNASTAVPSKIRATNTMDRILSRGGGIPKGSDIMIGVPLPEGEVRGTSYLNEKWNFSTLLLFDSENMLENIPVKYDLHANEIEVLTSNGTKVIPIKRIRSLVWKDSVTTLAKFFINASLYNDEGTPLTGLLEVAADGKKPFLIRNYVVVKQPDYVAGIDVGSRDTKIFKKTTLYYASGQGLTKITSKKVLLQAFGEDAAAVDKYIQDQDLSVKKEGDLVKIFNFYNAKYPVKEN